VRTNDSTRIRSALIPIAALVLLLAAGGTTLAQDPEPQYEVGDRVEADVNMSSTPEYEKWLPGTITKIEMWQGMVAGIFIKIDDSSGEHVSAARFLRPLAEAPPVAGEAAPVAGDVAPSAGRAAPPAATKTAPAPNGAAESRAGVSAGAATGTGTGNCRVGTRVTDRENRTGVVVRADGPSCHVKIDGTGEERYYLQWMLTPGGGTNQASQARNAAPGGPLETGSYSCWAANGVAGTLRLVIRSGSQYADGNGTAGSYRYDAGSGRITFQSGPWGGFYGTALEPGKIGISSRPGGFSNTVCNRG